MNQQLDLFTDDAVQADGEARPWRLKWDVLDGGAPDADDTGTTAKEAA